MGKGPSRKQVRDGAVQEPAFVRLKRVPLRDTPADKRDFFADVMDLVRQIPRGRVTSYGAIARYLGAAQSAAPMRAVLFIAVR